MTPTLIYCAGGNRRYAPIAIDCGFYYGAQLPSTLYFPIYFADQNYRHPRYVAYVNALKRYRPPLASVLDWSELRRIDEILMRAEEIARYTDEIMLIPSAMGGSLDGHTPQEAGGHLATIGGHGTWASY